MKRLVTMVVLWVTILFYSYANPNISLVGCVPSDESVISTFEFDLEFDLSEVYAEYGYSEDFGIGIGANSELGFKLYRGKDDSGDLLQVIYNYSVKGTSVEFQTGSTLHLKFNDNYMLDGETYALVINTSLTCRKKGETTSYSANLRYDKNPLIYTFVAKTNSENFALKDWSIEADANLNKIPDIIEISFTKDISIEENAKADIYIIYDGLYASNIEKFYKSVNISVNQSEPYKIVIDTGGFAMYEEWKYKIIIPDGLVYEKDNPTNIHPQISRTFIGNKVEYFTAESIEPVYDEHGCVEAVAITWNSPNPDQTKVQHALLTEAGWTMSVATDDEERTGSALRDGVGWPTSTHPLNYIGLKPSRIYTFHLDEGKIMGYLDGIYYCPGLINREINLQFETPSIGAATGITPAEYNYVGIYNPETINELMPIEDGYQTDYLGNVEVEIKDYTNDDKKWALNVKSYTKGQFFEITPEGDKLIKEYLLTNERRGNNGLYLKNTVVSPINYQLEKDKTYKMVIPENCLRIRESLRPSYENYVKSPALEFTFKGTDNLTGIRHIEESNLKVYPEENKIIFKGLSEGANVNVCTPDGIKISAFEATDSSALLEVSNGIYIVTVDGKSTTVIIR